MSALIDEARLMSEWLSFPGLTGRHIRQLSDAGISSAAWVRAGHLATPRITITGRFFMPDPFGTPAFVVPVYDGEPVSEINPDPSVPLVDLCAFRIEEPERWWLRIGAPHSVLGKDQFVTAMVTGSIVGLHATPLQWLKAECQGACLLDLAEGYQDGQRMRVRLTKLESVA